MYSLIHNKKQVIVIRAIDRAQLNNETNHVEEYLYNKFGDCEFDESRNYGENEIEIDNREILRDNPQIKNLQIVDKEDFVPIY